MFNIFSKKKKQSIAIDIGSHSTKIASYSAATNSLEQIILEITPEKLLDSHSILDAVGLGDFINNCMVLLNSDKDVSVVTGVSGKGVITKKIDMPYDDESLIQEYLSIEAEQYLPYDISDLELDYEILHGLPTTTENATPILLVAVLKNLLGSYEEAFSNSISECQIVDANVFALFNIFEKNYDMNPDKNYLLLDIGFQGSNIVAIINNQVVFTRYIPAGGDFHTHKIKDIMKLSYEEAEDLKKSLNQESNPPQELIKELKETINPLFCEEIFSGYGFYSSFFPDNLTSNIYITGGGSQIPFLTDALQACFNAPVEILNPFARLKLSSGLAEIKTEQLKAFSSVVAGLALRTAE